MVFIRPESGAALGTSDPRPAGAGPAARAPSGPSPVAGGLARGTNAAGPTSATLVARDVHKSFGSGRGRTPILRGVGLEAARGESVFLVGPSGSGKTTLLSLLGCILSPDRGTVEV